MTWFGKLLVLLNLALSLALATWALTLYTSRIDWSDQKGKDGQRDGELRARIIEAEDGWNAVPAPAYRWKEARAVVQAIEEGSAKLAYQGKEVKITGRPANQKWYQEQLELLRTGEKPILMLDLDAQRRMKFTDLDPLTPRPALAPAVDRAGNALKYLAYYNEQEPIVVDKLKKEQDRLDAAIKEDIRLTDALAMPGTLHARLLAERIKAENIAMESQLVKTPLINMFVESELLLKRKRSLEARLEELRKARAAQVAGLGQ
jgi:hypothetical protein